MNTEKQVLLPISVVNILHGQCGNIDILLARLEAELEVPNIKAANLTRSEISLEVEYIRKYLPPSDFSIDEEEFLTAESRQKESVTAKPELNPKIKLAATQSCEAVALYTALDMAYTLDGEIPCRLAAMLKDRLGEMSERLISVVQTHDLPF